MSSDEIIKVDYDTYHTQLNKKYLSREKYKSPDKTIEKAQLPGVIVEVHVKPGDEVKKNSPIYTLEAMKMHNIVKAKYGGVVKKINVKTGDRIIKTFPVIEYN